MLNTLNIKFIGASNSYEEGKIGGRCISKKVMYGVAMIMYKNEDRTLVCFILA